MRAPYPIQGAQCAIYSYRRPNSPPLKLPSSTTSYYDFHSPTFNMDLSPIPPTPDLRYPHKLPLELLDLIIDALADDRDPNTRALPKDTHRALTNCALVCSKCNSRAKRHLEAAITIKDVDSLTTLAARMSATSTVLYPHITSLFLTFPSDGRYPPSNVLTLLPILFRHGLSSINELSLHMPKLSSSQIQSNKTEQMTGFFPYLSFHPLISASPPGYSLP